MDHYTDMLDHLISMAKCKGAKEYAWWRAKQLAADESNLWTGIDLALAEAMKGASATATTAPEATTCNSTAGSASAASPRGKPASSTPSRRSRLLAR
jgi:hypothetical protein